MRLPGLQCISSDARQELEYYDVNAPLLGFMGAAVALIFSNLGAAYGTGKSGMGISALGVGKPDLVMKSIVPVVMAGVLGIYGLIIAVIIANAVSGVEQGRPAYGYLCAPRPSPRPRPRRARSPLLPPTCPPACLRAARPSRTLAAGLRAG